MRFESAIGWSAALGYAAVSAFARVFVEKAGNKLDPYLVLLVSLLIANVFFHTINLHKLRHIYQKVSKHKKDWCYVMLVTGVLWGSFFLGPHYISADDYTIIVFAATGFLAVMIYFYEDKRHPWITLTVALLYIAALYLAVQNETLTYQHLIGFGIALTSGIASYFFLIFSSRLQIKSGLSTSATLAVRWWLAIGVVFLLCFNKLGELSQIAPPQYIPILLPTFLGIIIPVYLAQTAAVKIGAQLAAIIQSVTPFFTVLVAMGLTITHFPLMDIFASILIMLAVVLFQIPFYQKRVTVQAHPPTSSS
ncbi:hypothetical protein BH10PSE19_BH10PSE19_22660 [soil metagenome]